jgi:hypothetical protein
LPTQAKPVEYLNQEFGFRFSLPSSWEGYSVSRAEWEGRAADEVQGEVVVDRGPLISIHHPQSSPQYPRQEIPILVFTVDQWDSLQRGDWWIGAAPIGPSELARNSQYVFALAARYNYAFLEGWEEVERILQANPLEATEPAAP